LSCFCPFAYYELRRDEEINIGEKGYVSNPNLGALRDFLEEFALVPIFMLSTHKNGGNLASIRARALGALFALHCTNYTAEFLQFLINYEKLKIEVPYMAAMFDENANNQNQGFIERMHASMKR
jgi:hypothetical protein